MDYAGIALINEVLEVTSDKTFIWSDVSLVAIVPLLKQYGLLRAAWYPVIGQHAAMSCQRATELVSGIAYGIEHNTRRASRKVRTIL